MFKFQRTPSTKIKIYYYLFSESNGQLNRLLTFQYINNCNSDIIIKLISSDISAKCTGSAYTLVIRISTLKNPKQLKEQTAIFSIISGSFCLISIEKMLGCIINKLEPI